MLVQELLALLKAHGGKLPLAEMPAHLKPALRLCWQAPPLLVTGTEDGGPLTMHDTRWVHLTREGWAQAKAVRPPEAESTGRKKGRPRKTEAPSATLILAALTKYHKYEAGGSILEEDPASLEQLANLAAPMSRMTVSKFLTDKLGKPGYKHYKVACAQHRIGHLIAQWLGEVPERRLDLLAEELGRSRHDD
jgi:hypothetical protein